LARTYAKEKEEEIEYSKRLICHAKRSESLLLKIAEVYSTNRARK